MKKLLLILFCLFLSFEVKSDVVEDLNKTNNVSRLEYSLDKLIPELESEIFGNTIHFNDDSRYEYSEKYCLGDVGKFDYTKYKTDKEMIIIGCRLEVFTQSMYKGKIISDERQSQNFNYLVNEGMELYSDRIAYHIFGLLGNFGRHINIPKFLSKFDNKYNLNQFLRNSKVTKIQEDYVNLLKERIVFSVHIYSYNKDGEYVTQNYIYPFAQKWEQSKGLPKFEKIKIYSRESRIKP